MPTEEDVFESWKHEIDRMRSDAMKDLKIALCLVGFSAVLLLVVGKYSPNNIGFAVAPGFIGILWLIKSGRRFLSIPEEPGGPLPDSEITGALVGKIPAPPAADGRPQHQNIQLSKNVEIPTADELREPPEASDPAPDVVVPTAEDLEEIRVAADIADAKNGVSQMGRGGLILLAGVIVTVASFLAASGPSGGIYFFAYGAIVVGAADLAIGYSKWRIGRERRGS